MNFKIICLVLLQTLITYNGNTFNHVILKLTNFYNAFGEVIGNPISVNSVETAADIVNTDIFSEVFRGIERLFAKTTTVKIRLTTMTSLSDEIEIEKRARRLMSRQKLLRNNSRFIYDRYKSMIFLFGSIFVVQVVFLR